MKEKNLVWDKFEGLIETLQSLERGTVNLNLKIKS